MVKTQRFGNLSNYALLKNTKNQNIVIVPFAPPPCAPHRTLQPQVVFYS